MKADYKYWKQLAAFAYGSYLDYGDGVVQIKEWLDQPFSPANIDEHFKYIPFDPDNDDIPMDAVEMIAEYDPETEVILLIEDLKGEKICLQLSAEKMGCTPLEAYKALHGKFVPGQVYKLNEAIDAVQPGYYIYNGEEKALLIFAKAGMDDDEGEICKTNEIINVHLDFKEYFTPTEMKISVE